MQAQWSAVVIHMRDLAQGNGKTLGDVSVGASAQARFTSVRLRGSAYCHLDAGAATETCEVGLGLINVKAAAFSAGVASMPGPLSDIEQSWVWHHIFTMGPAVLATDEGGDISRNSRIVIDSKSQRKTQIGEVLAFVAEGVILSGTPTWDIFASVREMVLIP